MKERRRADSYLTVDFAGTETLVHANEMRPYYVPTNNVGMVFEANLEFGSLKTVPHATEPREQCLVATKASNLRNPQEEELSRVLADLQEI